MSIIPGQLTEDIPLPDVDFLEKIHVETFMALCKILIFCIYILNFTNHSFFTGFDFFTGLKCVLNI